MIEKSQIDAGYVKLCDEIMEYNKSLNENKKYMFELEELNISNWIYLDSLEVLNDNKFHYQTKEIENFNQNKHLVLSSIKLLNTKEENDIYKSI